MSRGFSLIETLIYIVLFSIIVGGAVIGAYQIVESSDKISGKTIIEQEGNFLLRKIDWALTGAEDVSVVADELIIDSDNRFKLDNDKLQVSRDGGVNYTDLSSEAVTVSDLNFIHTTETNKPDKITASFKVSLPSHNQVLEQDFEITKYLRK